jgi:hypothetical protein
LCIPPECKFRNFGRERGGGKQTGREERERRRGRKREGTKKEGRTKREETERRGRMERRGLRNHFHFRSAPLRKLFGYEKFVSDFLTTFLLYITPMELLQELTKR